MKKILIIDDDEIFPKILADSLPKEKYEVIHVLNGKEGLKEMDKNKPDMIILDLIMPEMNGLEFLETLKKREVKNYIPILISSQLSKMKDISKAVTSGMEVGVKGYLIKASQNTETIVKTIENMVS